MTQCGESERRYTGLIVAHDESVPVYAFRVAYDGGPFHGFQRQPDVRTVEDTVFEALGALGVMDADADTPAGYAAAGRTDAGVSAAAQTVAFEAPAWLTPAALNSELPETIRAWERAEVSRVFHATHDAVSRTYRYHLYAPAGEMETDRARGALAALSGEHDFHNLTPDARGTVRDLDTRLERDGEFLVVTLRAGGFARQLVRRIVSLVAAIGAGDAPVSKVRRVLSPEPLAGPEGVEPAPAAGLLLAGVAYPGVEFCADETAAEGARAVFEERRVAATTAARVAGEIGDGLSVDPIS